MDTGQQLFQLGAQRLVKIFLFGFQDIRLDAQNLFFVFHTVPVENVPVQRQTYFVISIEIGVQHVVSRATVPCLSEDFENRHPFYRGHFLQGRQFVFLQVKQFVFGAVVYKGVGSNLHIRHQHLFGRNDMQTGKPVQ